MKYLFAVCLFIVSHSLFSQTGTIIIVRHAEKLQDGKDPDLSEIGKERALKLSEILSETKIDALFSTKFKRTTQTLAVIAKKKHLETNYYSPSDSVFILDYLKKNIGATIVISGHSNTVPGIVNYLCNSKLPDLKESEYDNLFIIHLSEGKPATYLKLKY
ncbi:MAG: histidine phosphatase family protein [Cyclobacteriaceae bacterium]|nr:histidine phosphatase family protein [Cyclobacteriaceae bacterium]